MATNFRDMGDYWPDAHAAGIAASLMLLGNGFRYGIIASSFSYNALNLNIPWGSNPLTDALLSSDSFSIINDGSMFDRTDKLEHIADWSDALDNMRVCWEGENLDGNCCKCEKCIRNILNFRVLGMDLPQSFKNDITDSQIETVPVPDLAILFEYKCMLAVAKKRNIDLPWVKSLEKCIQRNEQLLNNKGLWKKVRKKIALRSRLRKFYKSHFHSEKFMPVGIK
jgi:hypothetical protein